MVYEKMGSIRFSVSKKPIFSFFAINKKSICSEQSEAIFRQTEAARPLS